MSANNTTCRNEQRYSQNGTADTPKVLFLVNGLGIGGSERKTVSIVNALHGTSWNVHLAYLTLRTAGIDRLDTGVPLKYLERRGKLSLRAIVLLRKYILAQNFDVIVCVNLYPTIYAVLASILAHPFQRPKIILLTNATEFVLRKAKLQMHLYRPLLRFAQSIIFGCEFQQDLWCRRYKVDKKTSRVIYNGIDETRFSPDYSEACFQLPGSRSVRPQEQLVIGTIGQLRKEKNQVELINAFEIVASQLNNALLLIAGEGPERRNLETRVKDSKYQDRIFLLGQVPDVRPILRRLDIFVLPSISETFSNAVLEAMSMETAVVISGVGGSGEMVSNGKDGFIYEQGDEEALANTLLRIVTDESERRRIEQRARQTVIERFTFETMIDEYKALLSSIR